MTTAVQPSLREAILDRLRDLPTERLILFGSCARGEEDPYSDIDLAVVMRTDRPFVERALPFLERLHGIGRAADVFVYTPDEWARMRDEGHRFQEHLLTTGVALR